MRGLAVPMAIACHNGTLNGQAVRQHCIRDSQLEEIELYYTNNISLLLYEY
jgi:hypothetical protein